MSLFDLIARFFRQDAPPAAEPTPTPEMRFCRDCRHAKPPTPDAPDWPGRQWLCLRFMEPDKASLVTGETAAGSPYPCEHMRRVRQNDCGYDGKSWEAKP